MKKLNENMETKSNYRRIISMAVAIIAFAVITLVYFSPMLEGKRIKQHDIEMYKGMSKEVYDYREAYHDEPLWTNSMFGGMPAWNISFSKDSNKITWIQKVLSVGFPEPFFAVFISMLGFFLLLLTYEAGIWVSFAGAVAFGLSSYMFIILGAGHVTKAIAISYMAPVVAGILLAYKGKRLWGCVLAAVALALEVRADHVQITYYLAMTVAILIIAIAIKSIIEKHFGDFIKTSMFLVVAAVFGILPSTMQLYANYEYGKETTRGAPVINKSDDNRTQGLDRDYITQWSYGKGETWSLMIPNAKGGASAYIGRTNSALDAASPRFRNDIANQNAYWGDQPGTSGPVYVGAIVMFLFILSLFVSSDKLKWALLAATVLSILLSWGKNFMGFTNFFLDYLPGYSKFRAVSMTLVIAQFTIPFMAFIGMAEVVKNPERLKNKMWAFWVALGLTAGICLLFAIAPRLFFNFMSQYETEQFAALINGENGSVYKDFSEQLQNVRVAIFRKDAWRSFAFIMLSAVPIFLLAKGKLKELPAMAIVAVLILVDMIPVDKRYLNNDNFISKRQFDKPFTPTVADNAVLEDKSLDFRVLNLTKDVFNDASTSYFHKSVGGYNGAKLRRYQDVINEYLSGEVNNLRSSKSGGEMFGKLGSMKVLNMLNTKYLIYNPDAQPMPNANAYGNAWIVDEVRLVNTPEDEIDGIGLEDTRRVAVMSNEFADDVGDYHPTQAEGTITMTDYKPNHLTYSFSANEDKLVVFSEIWTAKKGWQLFIDGKESNLLRADYMFRAALIPAGTHEVVMTYNPPFWPIGNTIATVSSLILIAALLAMIVYSIVKWRKRKKLAEN